MSRISCLCSFLICSSGMLFLAGCGANQVTPLASPGGTSAGTTISAPPALPPAPPALPPATQKNLYVVQAGRDPVSTLVFPLTAHGSATPTLEIPGSQVAVDRAGNIYVLDQKGYPDFTVTSINVYSADSPTGKPIRSLPVGPGTKISAVRAMTVSPAGEIFISDFKGIAVFSQTATGDDDPVRYIQDLLGGSTAAASAAFMAVDNAGNLYVGNYGSPAFVFGPKDTGPVAPSRTIAGSLTQMGVAGCSGGSAMFGMTVDDSGDLYVLYRCQMERYAPVSSLAVYEFAPNANGNVAPIRTFTTPGMGIYYAGTGLAVDSAGTIYVSASYTEGQIGFVPAVFEFPATASGTVPLTYILTSFAWSRYPPPPGEDDWFDPSGSIALH